MLDRLARGNLSPPLLRSKSARMVYVLRSGKAGLNSRTASDCCSRTTSSAPMRAAPEPRVATSQQPNHPLVAIAIAPASHSSRALSRSDRLGWQGCVARHHNALSSGELRHRTSRVKG